MTVNRRQFLAVAAAMPAVGPPKLDSARKDFPWSERQVYLNPAGWHPISARSAEAVRRYAEACSGPGGEAPAGDGVLDEVKGLYGRLINAKPSEIAIVGSTLAGENVVAAGLGLARAGGNVVTDELHYHGGLYIYKSLEKAGLEVRIVKQRDWRIDVADMERAIDRNTRLVAITLVSNINGYLHNARAVSDLAHARGAYLYADVVQAAGCVPVDVRAMGIDFCAASGYKWLMGLRGFGFLYVREDLQERVLRPAQFGDRQYRDFEYHVFPGSPPGKAPFTWRANPGAARYEVGNVSNIGAVCQREALNYILGVGVEQIQARARPLVETLRREIPRLGYPGITPSESPAPIAAFLAEKPGPLAAKLRKAGVAAKVKWNQMRVSVTVFNNRGDIDRLLGALA